MYGFCLSSNALLSTTVTVDHHSPSLKNPTSNSMLHLTEVVDKLIQYCESLQPSTKHVALVKYALKDLAVKLRGDTPVRACSYDMCYGKLA